MKKFLLALSIAASALVSNTAHASKPLPSCEFSGWNSTFVWGVGVSAVDCMGAFTGNSTGTHESRVAERLAEHFGSLGGSGKFTFAGHLPTAQPFTLADHLAGHFVVVLKQGNGHSAYLLHAIAPTNQLFWSTAGVKTGGGSDADDDLSHATYYVVEGGVNATCVGVEACTSVVPEPSTYALMGVGLLGIFGVARRRRHHV